MKDSALFHLIPVHMQSMLQTTQGVHFTYASHMPFTETTRAYVAKLMPWQHMALLCMEWDLTNGYNMLGEESCQVPLTTP